MAKLLECACLFWRFLSPRRCRGAEITARCKAKRQKRQPHSTTLARGSQTPLENGEAFGVRLSFLALFGSTLTEGGIHSSVQNKAAEKTAALHDAVARLADTSRYWRSFWSAPVFSGAFLLDAD